MRIGFIAIGGALLLGFHCLLSALGASVAGTTFWWTLGALEFLEHLGLPTLTGSPSGWPLPTALGWFVAAVGWFCIYFVTLWLVVFCFTRLRGGHARSSPAT